MPSDEQLRAQADAFRLLAAHRGGSQYGPTWEDVAGRLYAAGRDEGWSDALGLIHWLTLIGSEAVRMAAEASDVSDQDVLTQLSEALEEDDDA